MKKLFVALSLVLTSQSALADYFFCELASNYGWVRARTEAEYRVYEAVAEDSEFKCEGKIVGNKIIVTATSVHSQNYKTVEQDAPQTTTVDIYGLANQGDFLVYANCTCGLN